MRHQRIDIVASDPALHLWKFGRDLVGFARAKIEHIAEQGACALGRVDQREVAGDF